MSSFLKNRIGILTPIIQAPMAGVSTPQLAAAVSEAGALGSIAIGALSPKDGYSAIEQTMALTKKPFGVNLFAHKEAQPDTEKEAKWLQTLRPYFENFGTKLPASIKSPYPSFLGNDALMEVLLKTEPPVISFHFGLPEPEQIRALKNTSSLLTVSVTSAVEAHEAKDAGIDFIIAQGIEAGGHRGIFGEIDPEVPTLDLIKACAKAADLPVVGAGGIMDGQGIRKALDAGAEAAQLGTAFISCPEAAAGEAYKKLLLQAHTESTAITAAISGRPARGLKNQFMEIPEASLKTLPDYPIAYTAGKALVAAAADAGSTDFSVMWAGTGAHKSRSMPAAMLVKTLMEELTSCDA
jgi:nitronate monooxygenase